MSQPKELKLARLPPRLDTFTDIRAPSVKKERVNGKDKYSLTPARPGVITIFSDGENERLPASRPRVVKRERSRVPSRTVEQGRKSSQQRIKQESLSDRHGPQRLHGHTTPVAMASDAGRSSGHEPLCRRQSQGRSNPPSDSSSSSDSSGFDSSDSSESEGESDSSSEPGGGSDSSSDSTSSEDSSSEDDASVSVYRPTTPASSLGSSPPKTRRKKQTGVQRASTNQVGASSSRRSLQNEPSIGSGHAPLDFFIDLPAHPLRSSSDLPRRSRSHISPTIEPKGAQDEHTLHLIHHRPSNDSPVVLGFMPINRTSPPPRNAPTEPRAMRIAGACSASAPAEPTRTQRESMRRSGPGPSSLPLRGPGAVKDNFQQEGEQRRGPARPGRIMQTIERQPVESLSTNSPHKNLLSRRSLRAATPGPSSLRTATDRASPGIFVTPRAVPTRPDPIVNTHDAPQSVSRSQGKRTIDETGDIDSPSKAAEWERMLSRIKNHEREMEQQRAQLEDTKRLLAEQQSRIDDLEQQRRDEELVRDSAAQNIEEPAVGPLPHLAHQDAPPAPVPCRQGERRDTCQSERRDKRKRRRSSRVARLRLQDQEQERIEQERQEDLELQQQLEQEQRRQAERIQCAARGLQNNARQAQALSGPAQRMLDAVQRRIQHDVFNRPLSGHDFHNLNFNDDDRPYISEATAFIMRLPQAFILARLRRLIEGRDFFETAHLGSTHLGCWVVSRRAACDLRMKLSDSGEAHNFSFARLAVRLWHDEQSLYSLLQHQSQPLKAGHTCHVDACMRPDHIVIETDRALGERRKCKARGRCYGHKTVHKDGTRQVRKPCIFFPRGVFVR